MTDKELIELAATDDAAAFRLAVQLGLMIEQDYTGVPCVRVAENKIDEPTVKERHGDDPCAATRKAIVRAALNLMGRN